MEIIKIPVTRPPTPPWRKYLPLLTRWLLALGFVITLARLVQYRVAGEKPLAANALSPVTIAPPATEPPAPSPRKVSAETVAQWRSQTAFLAGLTTTTEPAAQAFMQSKSWQAYAARLQQKWRVLDATRWQAVSRWAAQELPFAAAAQTKVFYPFGGPDFLYASLLFPRASDYFLVGLEPVGQPPALEKFTAGEMESYLLELEASLNSLMNFGFFKTNDMRADFSSKRLNGVLPVLLALLARTEHQVVDLELLHADAQGNWLASSDPQPPTAVAPAPKAIGVKIQFHRANESNLQTLHYFSVNLENKPLAENHAFTTFITAQKPLTTFVKSASYLMHTPTFSAIRELILAHSTALVQDDSGIPLRYLDETRWKLSFYGVYSGPISLFKGAYQADLKRRYNPAAKPQTLPFGLGYQWQPGTANLLLARQAEARARVTPAPPASLPPSTATPSATVAAVISPPSRKYTVVLAEFSNWNAVSPQLQQLVAQGEQVSVSQSQSKYRLSLGPYNNRTQAEQALTRFRPRWTAAQIVPLNE